MYLHIFLYNATIEFCQVRHVVHKRDLHELTMNMIAISALDEHNLEYSMGLFKFIDFCLSGMLAYLH